MLQCCTLEIFFISAAMNTIRDSMTAEPSTTHDCSTFAVTNPHSPIRDLFCCGHALLEDGRLLVAGGTAEFPGEDPGIHNEHFPGLRDSFAFDPIVRAWQTLPLMNPEPGRTTGGGRWYPTLVTLPAGQSLAMSGHPAADDTRHNNTSIEVYSPDLNRWVFLSQGDAAHEVTYYPRLHVLPNGNVFSASPIGPNRRTMWLKPTSGEWFDLAPGPSDGFYDGIASTSVLLPLLPEDNYRPRVLICGGSQPLMIDLSNPAPAWTPTPPRTIPGTPKRRHLNAVLLPTGDVFVCGGVSDDNQPDTSGVLPAEVFNPATNAWSTRASASVVRNYHSVALLMPDGRVWTAGSNHNAQQSFPNPGVDNRELRIEIYEPWYFSAARPHLSEVPEELDYGMEFELACPQAANIRRVALIRAGSCTHAFNPDQRYLGLRFAESGASRLRVIAPPDNYIAPPGRYLLFAVDDQGIPSTGTFTHIRRPRPTGNPVLVQSKYGRRGNFELIVPLEGGGLGHYWRNNDDPSFPWHGPRVFGTAAGSVDAVTFIQGTLGEGNFELVARCRDRLFLFWRDRSPDLTWTWHGPFPLQTQ